jgi:transcriptional regulator with GAF, ATPase, and Fis domain
MEVALEQTGAHHGAILLWDEAADGLVIHFHVVDGLVVTLPDDVLSLRRGARFNGVASYAFAMDDPYVCRDAATDPHYAPYYFDVRSVAAVPIRYQDKPFGVLSVSSRRRDAFDESTLAQLSHVADSASLFLRRAQLYLASRAGSGRPFFIKGLSPEWLEVERRIEKVSATHAPVLITGESGTGKELVAHAIHFNSPRKNAPFVSVNCAAIPETLLESVLFGHVRGAFTGATSDKRGEFQKADGGTLFLDELGELPVPLQAKVLRALEDGEVQPLGSDGAPRNVDVRVVCATNRDLPAMMRRGEFRDDLFYRLSVMTMRLPPLRSYKEHNLPTIVHVFLKQAANRHSKDVRTFSTEAMAMLLAYDYPGNVRELKNIVEHAVIMTSEPAIAPHDLPQMVLDHASRPPRAPDGSDRGPEPAFVAERIEPYGPASSSVPPALAPPARTPSAGATLAEMRERWLAPLERSYLQDVLRASNGNVRRAAEVAGVNTVTMYRLLEKRGMGRARGRL